MARFSFKIVFAAVAICVAGCGSWPKAENQRPELVYIGTHAKQIQALRFDPATGRLSNIGPVAELPRPSWTVAHPTLPVLYAVDEASKDGHGVVAFAIDRRTGALSRMGDADSGGAGATHLWLDAASATLLVANYDTGSASSIAINPDGSLGKRISTMQASGSGPHKRQAGPHAHSVAVDPSGRYALVADMGVDRLFVYRFDRASHTLATDDAGRSFVAPPGTGPRHFAVAPGGRFVYLVSELTAEIITLQMDAHGALTPVQSLPTSSPGFQGTKSGSEVAVSADGRFVYVGNRAESALLVFGVDAESGRLTPVQRIASGGEIPWAFGIDPSGKWMIVTNRQSNRLSVFGIDQASGLLADTGQSVASPTPVSVTFVP